MTRNLGRIPDVFLYAVYLGGSLAPGRMGEDHEVVFVVGTDDLHDVRKRAKRKWTGAGRAHIDAVVRLDQIDGYAVDLRPGGDGDVVDLERKYFK